MAMANTYTKNYTAQTTRPQSMLLPSRVRDVVGRMKVSVPQNIYEADFEYNLQPMRWENFTANTGSAGSIASVVQFPGTGGVRMLVGNNSGDLTIRQSRPYHRYQPGKTMYMATAANFGAATANNYQRIGFFDDSNGVFFEQGVVTANNPSGIYCVIRSDAGTVSLTDGTTISNTPKDTKFSYETWYGDPVTALIDWTKIQMLWLEYAWYGAGAIRWGVLLNGEPYVLHEVGAGNGNYTGNSQQSPWSRTGNLPVRYEQRNVGATSANSVLIHYGVSVMVENRQDAQRGFTYSYGMTSTTPRRNVPAANTRFPVVSVRMNNMGVSEISGNSTVNPIVAATSNTTYLNVTGTPWVSNAYVGRAISIFNVGVAGNTMVGRIANNTANTAYINEIISNTSPLPVSANAGNAYSIGLINRGQILPQSLIVSSDNTCIVELIVSTTASPIVLTGASMVSMNTIGSINSLAQRDVSATGLTGGEVIYAFTAPSGGSGLQTFDLTNVFALYNNVRGNQPDILTVAVSTSSAAGANVGAHLVAQEAMS